MSAWMLLIVIVCLCIGGLASTLMFALRDFSFRRLEEIADRNGGIERLKPILDDADSHALSMGAVRVVFNIAATIFLVVALAPAVAVTPAGGGEAVSQLDGVRLLIAGVLSVVLLYVMSVLVPHAVAEHAGERLIHGLAPAIRLTHVLATPLRALGFVEVAVRRLAGEKERTEEEEREEEILSAVSEGEHEGTVKEAERQMIENVVEFWSTTVEEVMTPRTEVEGFELTDDLEFIRGFIEQAGHSRIPVYEGDLDHIIGVLYAKDLLKYLGTDLAGFSLRPLLREATFVPESKLISELLLEIQSKKVHLAIVLDEYGGTAGLITVEDLLEEIVGEIQDEYEPEHDAPPCIHVNSEERTAEVDARAYIDDANEALSEIGIELPEDDGYDTVGGYVMARAGRIPAVGESLEAVNGLVISVLEAEPTRVLKVRITPGPTTTRPAMDGGESEASRLPEG